MATPNSSSAGPRDFSEPWKFSDVVLVVEEQRFHVHRSTLAMWSPVFEKMFTSDFKEKNSGEIPLPGKKASEIKELLQIMYPSLEEKVVTKGNCYFLLDLAREYQITSITLKCSEHIRGSARITLCPPFDKMFPTFCVLREIYLVMAPIKTFSLAPILHNATTQYLTIV